MRIVTYRVLMLLALALCAPLACRAVGIGVDYAALSGPLTNPLIGNVVWADDEDEHEQPFTLVYADLTWAEFEPAEGAYDFERFEEDNQLALWRELGKHVVFRFVVDKPGDKKHMDIPEWLYDQTGDGEHYKTEYGRGYNPNYENERFIEKHAQAIAALGARYGQDDMFAFVELGSLGHWGEWHVHDSLSPLPPALVRDRYVAAYIEAFPNAMLMTRRPFYEGMGLYNDAAGDASSTEDWLDWIKHGGEYDQAEAEEAMPAMPDAYLASPIGGELSTSYKPKNFLSEGMMDQTLDLFKRSHTSWIGPGSFSEIERDGEYQANLDALMSVIGYRIRVKSARFDEGENGALGVTLTWVNDGIAPFYFDWPMCLKVGDAIVRIDADVRQIKPGESYETRTELAVDEGSLYVGILNPATERAAVALAMDVPTVGLWHKLARLSP